MCMYVIHSQTMARPDRHQMCSSLASMSRSDLFKLSALTLTKIQSSICVWSVDAAKLDKEQEEEVGVV